MRMEEPDPHRRVSWTDRLLARGAVLFAAVLLVGSVAGAAGGGRAAAEEGPPPDFTMVADEVRVLNGRLETTRNELAIARAQAARGEAIIRYSGTFQIPADLAAGIYDIALSEGIDPLVAFRLVQAESGFRPRARSSRDAIGYTQVQLRTARYYEPGLTEEQLYERDVNLRVGFRFLRDLMRRYNGDLELALAAYNRGPGKVEELLLQGRDPSNRYARSILRGTPHERTRRP